MNKFITALTSLAAVVGLAVATQAGAATPDTKSTASQTTSAPPALSASTRAADLAKFGKDTRLSAAQLKALGLKPLSRRQLARVKQLQTQSKGVAEASAVGATYWHTWQNARNSWSDRYYSGPYDATSPPWYYFVIYDNWKTCTFSGTGCIDARTYTYQYYLYYKPNQTWYWYNTCGYQSNSTTCSGFGPYAS